MHPLLLTLVLQHRNQCFCFNPLRPECQGLCQNAYFQAARDCELERPFGFMYRTFRHCCGRGMKNKPPCIRASLAKRDSQSVTLRVLNGDSPYSCWTWESHRQIAPCLAPMMLSILRIFFEQPSDLKAAAQQASKSSNAQQFAPAQYNHVEHSNSNGRSAPHYNHHDYSSAHYQQVEQSGYDSDYDNVPSGSIINGKYSLLRSDDGNPTF